MKTPIHILYLPGFNGAIDGLRLRALKWWHYRDVTAELVPMRWESKETFEQKIARIDQAIDRARGKRIVIIGESAAGSMAVHTYARRSDDLYRVMTVCGKNTRPETVGEEYYHHFPAFRPSMERLNESLANLTEDQRRNFVSIHPLYDGIVPVRDTIVPGCRRVRLWTVGHFLTNVAVLTVLSPIVVRAAKK